MVKEANPGTLPKEVIEAALKTGGEVFKELVQSYEAPGAPVSRTVASEEALRILDEVDANQPTVPLDSAVA